MAASGANPPGATMRWKDWWKERWKKPGFRWGIIVTAAVLFLLGLFFYPEQPEFRVRSLVARAAPSKDRPIEVEARLDKNLFEHNGEQATLRVTVTNRTSSANTQTTNQLTSIEVFVEAPGFGVNGTEQSTATGQKFFECVLPDDAQGKPQPSLPAGESCTTQLTLTADESSGTSAVTIFADWNEGAPEEASLSLGPVKFDSLFGAARWNRLGRRAAQVLRDLMIPIVLALIGIWFNRKQDDREELRRNNERKEGDRQQVRILLLKTVMELEKNHYLPIISVATDLMKEMEKDTPSTDMLFFHVLMLLKRMDHLKRKEGGVFFEKRSGEYAAQYAWLILREAMYGALDEAAISNSLANVVGIPWEYSSFLRAAAQLKSLRDQFEKWLKEPPPNAPKDHPSLVYGQFKHYYGVLDAIQAIFRFEGDRALSEGWYGEEAKINFRSGKGQQAPEDQPVLIPTFTGKNFPNIQDNARNLKKTLVDVYRRKAELDEIR